MRGEPAAPLPPVEGEDADVQASPSSEEEEARPTATVFAVRFATLALAAEAAPDVSVATSPAQLMSDSSDESSDDEGTPSTATQIPLPPAGGAPAPAKSKGSRRGKGKASKAAAAAAQAAAEEALLAGLLGSAMDLDADTRWDAVLEVDESALRPVSEFKALFGAQVIAGGDAEEEGGEEEGGGAAPPQQGKRARRRAKAAARAAKRAAAAAPRSTKRYHLVTPEAEWPTPRHRTAGGLSMRQGTVQHATLPQRGSGIADVPLLLSPEGGRPLLAWAVPEPGASVTRRSFQYEHGDAYAAMQAEYTARVATYDPNAVVGMLQVAPLHVDCNLQVSEIHRATRQGDEASRLLRRALYTLEHAWHPHFAAWGEGRVRLPWAHATNRSIFTALFRHAHATAKGGAPRTALQLARLLLQLDPTADPQRMLLGIGHYACRAQRNAWLRRLSQPPVAAGADVPGDVCSTCVGALGFAPQQASVWLLPSTAFQRAVATFQQLAGAVSSAAGHSTPSTLASWAKSHPDTVPFVTPPALGVLLPDAGNDTALWLACSRGTGSSAAPTTGCPNALAAAVNAVALFPHAAMALAGSIGLTESSVGTAQLGGKVAAPPDGKGGVALGIAGCPAAAVAGWTPPEAAVWAAVLGHPLMAESVEEDAEAAGAAPEAVAAYTKLIDVMVARDTVLWKDAGLALLLFHALALVAAGGESDPEGGSDPPPGFILDSTLFRTVFPGGQRQAAAVVQQGRAMRHAILCAVSGVDVLSPEEEFGLSPHCLFDAASTAAVWKHYGAALVSDFSEDEQTMAADVLAGAQGVGGGGLDEDAELLADIQAQAAAAGGGGGPPLLGDGLLAPLDMDQNPFMLFLQSLLPGYRVPGTPAMPVGADGQPQPQGEQAAAAAVAAETAAVAAAVLGGDDGPADQAGEGDPELAAAIAASLQSSAGGAPEPALEEPDE